MKSTFNFNRPYTRNKEKVFSPLYLPGERYSFYINFSGVPPSEPSFFQLWIINPHTNTQIVSIPNLQYIYVAGFVGYHLWIPNFVFPKIPDGQYYFQIFDVFGGGSGHGVREAARSNIIEVSSKCLYNTSYIEFRHNDELYGVRYDLLPVNFYQRFRLPINQIKAPEISSTRDQYRQSSGQRELRNSKSFRDIKQTLEMYWSNAEDFEALSAMLEHSDVRINGSKLICLDQVKVEQPSDFGVQYKGTFTVIVKEDLDRYDLIVRGGTNNYFYNNFLKGR